MMTPSRSTFLADIQQKQAKLEKMARLVEALDNQEVDLLLSLLCEYQRARVDYSPAQPAEPVISVTTKQRSDVATGKLDLAVRNALHGMEYFTVPELVRLLETSGFVFAAKSPLAAVNQVVKKLKDSGKVEEIEAGAGRKPSKYKNLSIGENRQLSIAS